VTATFTVPVPVAQVEPGSSRSVPALTLSAPVTALARRSASVPEPILVRPDVPASGAARVAVAPTPSGFTVTVGAPVVASVRTLPEAPPSLTIQLPADATSVSANSKLPTVRGESSCTMVSSSSSTVVKLAVVPAPDPRIPSCQFALSLHRPPLVLRIQEPFPSSSRVNVCPVVKPRRGRDPPGR
jgi:hypothetical protein